MVTGCSAFLVEDSLSNFRLSPKQVFKSADQLEKFLSLRVRATLFILREAVSNVAEFSLADESDTCKTVIASLESLPTSDPVFTALVTCDVLLSSKDWTTSWASSLSSATSASSLADNLMASLGLDKEEIFSSLKREKENGVKGVKEESAAKAKVKAEKTNDDGPGGYSALLTLLMRLVVGTRKVVCSSLIIDRS